MFGKSWRDLRVLLVTMSVWLLVLVGFTWANFRICGRWPVMFWGWEGELFYILYNNILTGQLPYVDFFIEYPPLVAYFIAWPWAWLGEFIELSDWDFRALFVLGIGLWLIGLFWLQDKIYRAMGVRADKIMKILWLTFGTLIISYTLVFLRFDIFPAMLTVLGLSIYLLYQKSLKTWHLIFASFFVILAGFLKIYAFVLAPMVILVELWQKRYWNLTWIVGVFVLILTVHLPFLIYGSERFVDFLEYQQSRSVQIESLYAGPIFLLEQLGWLEAPVNLQNGTNAIDAEYAFLVAGWAQPITLIFLVILFTWLAWLFWKRPQVRSFPNLLEFIAIFSWLFVLTFVLFNYIFSPQYLVWLLLLLPLASVVTWQNNRKLGWFLAGTLVAVSCLTFLIYPAFYEFLKQREWWMVLILNLRNLGLLLIWFGLIYLAFDRAREVGKPESDLVE